jgi:acyl carrier protein
VARLVIQCEKYFKINIHDEDVHTFKCVKDIVEYIENLLSDK